MREQLLTWLACSMVNNVDDMSVVHKKMESLGPVHQRNRCLSASQTEP